MSVMPSWDAIRWGLNQMAQQDGNWAGAPLPVSGIPLVIEPRYPYAKLNGFCLDGEAPRPASDDDTPAPRVRNSWHSIPNNATVYICDDGEGTPVFHVMLPNWGGARLRMWIDTIGASRAWSIETEMRAMETLRGLLNEGQFESYFLTGAFLETSKRSRVTYLFRKLRPTVALKATAKGDMRILTALCLHPIGYYQESWAGVMCPSDDVLSHLLLMRGAEHQFWKKAEHHPSWEPGAGI